VAFVLFVRWNEGIVVGDRTAHQAVLHLPQLLYFSLFFLALCCSFTLPAYLADFLVAVKAHPRLSAACLLLMGVVVHLNTLAHPYLLADNRHLTFYIWRRFFARHWMAKFLPLPAYMFGLYSLGRVLNR
jgi:alpha-1,2-glucosyltransferase